MKSIKKNYVYNTAYQILALLTPLITTPYISRVLGAEGIGLYSYSASIVAYFVLVATLGTARYGQREISYHQENRKERSIIFWELWILVMIISVVAVIAYLLFCYFYKLPLIYIVQVISVLSVGVNIVWLLQGMEDFKNIVIRNMIIKVVDVAFIFIFVKKPEDLIIYVIGIVGINFISNLFLWPLIKKYVDKTPLSTLSPFRHLRATIKLFIPTIAISVYTVLDKTMIGIITQSSAQNGYYEQAMKIVKITLVIVTSLGSVMIPRIGFLFSSNKSQKMQKYMYRGYNFVWFMGIPLCFGIIGISRNFVPWFFGPGYTAVIPILCISSLLILAIGINATTGVQYLIPTKREGLFTKTVIIGAGTNFVFNLLMIPRFAAVGAIIASVIAESTIAIIQLIYVRKELSIRRILKMMAHYLFAGICMLGILLLENRFMKVSILNTVLMVLSGGMVYFLVLFILKDVFFIDNARLILKKMKAFFFSKKMTS